MIPPKIEDLEENTPQGGGAAALVAELIDACDALNHASAEFRRRVDQLPTDMMRVGRVMIGFHLVDGQPVPIFAENPQDLNLIMDRWEQALRGAGGSDRDLKTVSTIRQLFLGDLEADRKRVSDFTSMLGIPAALDAMTAAQERHQAAAHAINRHRARGLSDANALAMFLALQAREKADPAAYGAVAVALQRSIAEEVSGTDQAPMMEG
jgi:hypothetical protein